VGEFSPDWLAAREAADARARSARLVAELAGGLARLPGRQDGAIPVTVVDLGCGTGANFRYLAPALAAQGCPRQRWLCLDRDPDLLAALPRWTADWAGRSGLTHGPRRGGLSVVGPGADWDLHTRLFDLAAGAEALPLEPGAVVTASALLDLVSEAWLGGLLRASTRSDAPLLLALTYDGRVAIEPAHPLDAAVIDLVNAHQRREKGLGPALGACAAERVATLAQAAGFTAWLAESDWVLDADDARLQHLLVAGWAGAAREQAAPPTSGESAALQAAIARWLKTRQAEVTAGRSRIRVGHRDALLRPPDGQPPVAPAAPPPAPGRPGGGPRNPRAAAPVHGKVSDPVTGGSGRSTLASGELPVEKGE
jgi:SAM-dependent methyltransferase